MFIDRKDAAQQLTQRLVHLKNKQNLIVLAIPRGGLVIGSIVANALHAPLDIILTKKIGAPYNKEFAVGAATPTFFFVDPEYQKSTLVQQEISDVQELLKRRAQLYRQGKPAASLMNKTVIITDDGVATGHTMRAAVLDAKKQNPKEIIIATPVIAPEAKQQLEQNADEVISVITPPDLTAIGAYYQNFDQVSDEEAMHILQTFKQEYKP